MQFMLIERFHPGKQQEMYRRFEEKGRLLPEGVTFIGSWITEDIATCYQVMEAADTGKLQQWIDRWKDLVDFEVIPVISSAEAKAKVFANAAD